MSRTLTPEELKSSQTEVELIDVRREADRTADPVKIPGAAWRNPEQANQWINDLPDDKDIVIYCARGGSVSNSVLDKLLASKRKARYLEGGIAAWKDHGGMTEQT